MTIKPVRLQLSRRKGFKLKAHSREANGLAAVNSARPGPLGNPFIVGKHGTRARCVELHQALLAGYICLSVDRECGKAQDAHRKYVIRNIDKLRGQNLACWCHGSPCHADTLLTVFNAPKSTAESARAL